MHEIRGTLDSMRQCRANEDGSAWVLWLVRTSDGRLLWCSGVVQGMARDFHEGDALLLVGRPSHGKYGETFKFVEALRQAPVGHRQIAAFITRCAHGRKLGIGKATADRLATHYGEEAIDALLEPARANADGLLSEEAAAGLAAAIREESETLAADIQWHATLEPIKGLARKRAIASARKKRLTLEAVQRDLYQLVLRRVPGCSFARIDAPALTSGLPSDPAEASAEAARRADLIHRHGLAVWEQIARTVKETGDVWVLPPRQAQPVAVEGLPGGAAVDLDAGRGLNYLLDLRWVEQDKDGVVALQPHAEAERLIARHAATLLKAGPGILATVGDLDVSEHQREALAKLGGSRLCLLTGGPGTGKTHVIGRLVKALGNGRVALAAPTGKAAVRITESLRAAGCVITEPARTLHSRLGIQPPADDEEVGTFGDTIIGEPLVVVDEVSMCDVELMARLLVAVPSTSTILLVGDTGQLPPVGPGSPLRDLVAAGVPRAHLTETRRNGGRIVEACKALAAGEPVDWMGLPPATATNQTENLAFWSATDPVSVDLALTDFLTMHCEPMGFDPIRDVQVLCATNATRKRLNGTLQRLLNPGDSSGWNPGDKVICLKNGELSGKRVANGDTGTVLAVKDDKATVLLTCPDREVVCRVPNQSDESGEGEDGTWMALAYAITGHKSQGSEYPCVVLVADQRNQVTSREWVYTAISRAKRLCVIVGKADLLDAWCRKVVLPLRRTKLAGLIREKLDARTDKSAG